MVTCAISHPKRMIPREIAVERKEEQEEYVVTWMVFSHINTLTHQSTFFVFSKSIFTIFNVLNNVKMSPCILSVYLDFYVGRKIVLIITIYYRKDEMGTGLKRRDKI